MYIYMYIITYDNIYIYMYNNVRYSIYIHSRHVIEYVPQIYINIPQIYLRGSDWLRHAD